VVQEWLLLQTDVKLIDFLPQASDMNPIKYMWGEVKRKMQEMWPVLSRNSTELWTIVSGAWDEVASSQCYVRSLIESMTRQMKSAVESQGF